MTGNDIGVTLLSWADCTPLQRANRIALLCADYAERYPGRFVGLTADFYLNDPDGFKAQFERDAAAIMANDIQPFNSCEFA